MSESISKNNELENEMTLDMSYFWYSDVKGTDLEHCIHRASEPSVLDCSSIQSIHFFYFDQTHPAIRRDG